MIELKRVCKEYNGKTVLKDFDLDISPGEVLCIMGPSGVGKTTLLRIIMGLEEADSGFITELSEIKMGAVFQEDRLCEDFDAITNVELVLSKNVKKEEVKKELLTVGIPSDEHNKPISQFSGGMKRRVAIVRCMLSDASVLLMDEPLKGLDDTNKKLVSAYINEKRQGRTMLIVTHDRADIERFHGNVMELSSFI